MTTPSARGWPRAYVITRNHNALELTRECLASLTNLTYPNVKVLVLDDGSRDGSGAKIAREFPNVEVLTSRRYVEYCRGLNLAARHALDAGAEYIFFVNNDTKDFSPDYLERAIEPMEKDTHIGIVGTECLDYDGGVRTSEEPKDKLGVRFNIPTEGYVVRRSVFRDVGFFDERLVRYFEDLDLLIRLRAAGYETAFVPTARFSHFGSGTSSRQIFIPNYYRTRNLCWFLKRRCADKPRGWRKQMSRRYVRVHTDRAKRSFREQKWGWAIGVAAATALGLTVGTLTRWPEDGAIERLRER